MHDLTTSVISNYRITGAHLHGPGEGGSIRRVWPPCQHRRPAAHAPRQGALGRLQSGEECIRPNQNTTALPACQLHKIVQG
eukprot:9483988-Pyramimonas_sp.AAC.1